MKKDRVFIRLTDIPDEGRSYTYDRETGEFNLPLKDLIDENLYKIDFFIRPVGNVFEVTGKVSTTLTRICSKCGYDLALPVETKIHEILMPKTEDAKGDTQSKSGFLAKSVDDEALAVTYVSGGVLNGEDMIHEIVALSDPAFPSCGKDKCENLEEVEKKLRELAQASELALQGKNTAFEVLKSLKIQNSKN